MLKLFALKKAAEHARFHKIQLYLPSEGSNKLDLAGNYS